MHRKIVGLPRPKSRSVNQDCIKQRQKQRPIRFVSLKTKKMLLAIDRQFFEM